MGDVYGESGPAFEKLQLPEQQGKATILKTVLLYSRSVQLGSVICPVLRTIAPSKSSAASCGPEFLAIDMGARGGGT